MLKFFWQNYISKSIIDKTKLNYVDSN